MVYRAHIPENLSANYNRIPAPHHTIKWTASNKTDDHCVCVSIVFSLHSLTRPNSSFSVPLIIYTWFRAVNFHLTFWNNKTKKKAWKINLIHNFFVHSSRHRPRTSPRSYSSSCYISLLCDASGLFFAAVSLCCCFISSFFGFLVFGDDGALLCAPIRIQLWENRFTQIDITNNVMDQMDCCWFFFSFGSLCFYCSHFLCSIWNRWGCLSTTVSVYSSNAHALASAVAAATLIHFELYSWF